MSEDFKVQASVKDFDGDMVNFRANSVDELKAEFAGFPYAEWADAKAQIRALSAIQPTLQPAQSAAPPATPTQAPVPFNGPPPAGQVKTCAHGAREFKSGVSAKGPWKAWFCPLPKGTPGACEADWGR